MINKYKVGELVVDLTRVNIKNYGICKVIEVNDDSILVGPAFDNERDNAFPQLLFYSLKEIGKIHIEVAE